MLKRLKSYKFWIATAALVPMVCQLFGYKMPNNYGDIVNAVLTVLVAAGIIDTSIVDNTPSVPTDITNDSKTQ